QSWGSRGRGHSPNRRSGLMAFAAALVSAALVSATLVSATLVSATLVRAALVRAAALVGPLVRAARPTSRAGHLGLAGSFRRPIRCLVGCLGGLVLGLLTELRARLDRLRTLLHVAHHRTDLQVVGLGDRPPARALLARAGDLSQRGIE